jgi:hypothetical protein
MIIEYKTVVGLKAQLSKFSGIISKGFRKPKKKLIKEMLYGIQASKDVKLSNISRTLKGDQSLIKTEDRLSRNLDDEDFTDAINEQIMRLAAPKVTQDMVIAIDPGDLRKKYAKKMEFLGKVRDGSENEIGDGYPLCKAVATDIESHGVIPLYCEAYSFLAEGVKSENSKLLKLIDTIFRHLQDRGIHAMDRGETEGFFIRNILGRKAETVCDSLGGSGCDASGRRRNCGDLAKVLPTLMRRY